MYLLDSDYIADYLKGRARTVQETHRLAPSGISTSIICYGEILEGIYYGGDPQRNLEVFELFLKDVPVRLLNRRIMTRFARIRGGLRSRGC